MDGCTILGLYQKPLGGLVQRGEFYGMEVIFQPCYKNFTSENQKHFKCSPMEWINSIFIQWNAMYQ